MIRRIYYAVGYQTKYVLSNNTHHSTRRPASQYFDGTIYTTWSWWENDHFRGSFREGTTCFPPGVGPYAKISPKGIWYQMDGEDLPSEELEKMMGWDPGEAAPEKFRMLTEGELVFFHLVK